MELLLLGYVTGSFGLDGTLKILSKTNLGNIRYKKGNKVFLCHEGEEDKELTVISYRNNGDIDFVRFNEITTKEDAEAKKGYSIKAIKDTSILKEGYYYFSDLEGCKITNKNEIIGKVIKVEEFPAHITLRVKHTSGKEFFVPFIKEFINSVSIENKTIDINLWEGML